jgi:hypothetical protein
MVSNRTSGSRAGDTVLSRNVPGNASDDCSFRAPGSGCVVDNGDAQRKEDTTSEFHHGILLK